MACYVIAQQSNGDNDANRACSVNRPKVTVCNGEGNDDCNSDGYYLCIGSDRGIRLSCPIATPFCVTDTAGDKCSVTRSVNSRCIEKSSFHCTSEGIFPNPTNCQQYNKCTRGSGSNIDGILHYCATGYVFSPNSPETLYCKRGVPCIRLDCTRYAHKFIAYGVNGQYYAYCNAATDIPIMFRCPDNHIVDVTKTPPVCNFKCIREGLVAHPFDTIKYYNCIYDPFRRLVAVVMECSGNRRFVPGENVCR
ncbi:unnamed protein product [Diamesa tonsa]